ncbi:hypothetical protein PPS11_02773 [Pseudomonas putida S11]|nr:hypothetical protein PPS11_02773 [Pseudomonas putida S11]
MKNRRTLGISFVDINILKRQPYTPVDMFSHPRPAVRTQIQKLSTAQTFQCCYFRMATKILRRTHRINHIMTKRMDFISIAYIYEF